MSDKLSGGTFGRLVDMEDGGSSQLQNFSVCLDETKQYFVLRRTEDIKDASPILTTVGKGEAQYTFKQVCDQYECGVRSVDHIYCYGCDGHSHGICPEHPLVFVMAPMEADALSTLPSFLELKQSNLPGAGVGVFTKIFLPAGSAFGPYGGFMVYGDDSKVCHDYSWEIEVAKKDTVMTVDASDPKRSNFLRWINCARFREEQNMICIQCHKKMFYVVFRPINPGHELTVWYGDEYAKRLGITNLRRSTDAYAPPKAKRDPKAFMTTLWQKTEDQSACR